MLSMLSYDCGPCVCPLWRTVYSGPLLFLIWLLIFLASSHMSSIYILEIKPLSEVSLANMFSHIVGSLFILMLFSLAMQKLFILMRSHLFILSFMSLALGDISMNTRVWSLKYIKNSYDFTPGRQKSQLKNGQKTWTDTSPRRTFRGPRDIRIDAQHR